MAAAAFLLDRTRFGRHTYAIGGSIDAAMRSGIDAPKHLLLVYVISSSLATLSGIIYMLEYVTGKSDAGSSFMLDSVVAVVIGGASLFGGTGTVRRTILGVLILATAGFFVPIRIEHPIWMVIFLLLTAVTFSLLGFVLGIWADGFEKLQIVPLLIITPLAFLGGSFYSIKVLPPFWQTVTLFNPVVYLVSGFRWSFYGTADVGVGISLAMTFVFLAICLGLVWWIFKTGYRLKM